MSIREAVLDKRASSEEAWLELPGVQVVDLRRKRGNTPDVETLRRRLRLGLAADTDPRRANFYEASMDGFRYYFHVALRRPPKVFLLARWREE